MGGSLLGWKRLKSSFSCLISNLQMTTRHLLFMSPTDDHTTSGIHVTYRWPHDIWYSCLLQMTTRHLVFMSCVSYRWPHDIWYSCHVSPTDDHTTSGIHASPTDDHTTSGIHVTCLLQMTTRHLVFMSWHLVFMSCVSYRWPHDIWYSCHLQMTTTTSGIHASPTDDHTTSVIHVTRLLQMTTRHLVFMSRVSYRWPHDICYSCLLQMTTRHLVFMSCVSYRWPHDIWYSYHASPTDDHHDIWYSCHLQMTTRHLVFMRLLQMTTWHLVFMRLLQMTTRHLVFMRLLQMTTTTSGIHVSYRCPLRHLSCHASPTDTHYNIWYSCHVSPTDDHTTSGIHVTCLLQMTTTTSVIHVMTSGIHVMRLLESLSQKTTL